MLQLFLFIRMVNQMIKLNTKKKSYIAPVYCMTQKSPNVKHKNIRMMELLVFTNLDIRVETLHSH